MRMPGSEAGLSAFSADLAATPASSLAPREREMLLEYARHGDQRSAALAIGVTVSTGKSYLTKAYRKLDVQTGIGAFRVLGWLHIPEVAA